MSQTAAARTPPRGTLGPIAIVLVVVTAVIIGTLVDRSVSSSSRSFSDDPRGDQGGATASDDEVVTEDDGVLPGGVTVFDDEHPGVGNLDPDLSHALRDAATDAAVDGIELHVNSGWRSPEYQDLLLREAVAAYGSEQEAARWVATTNTSAHVSGDALDIGPFEATAWLSEHGAAYGLCQIFANEVWHYELRPQAIDRGCPPMSVDPAHDPTGQP